jgi:hypothetical protein
MNDDELKGWLNDRGLALSDENIATAKQVVLGKPNRTLEEIVITHVIKKEQPALLYRCINTGEVGTMKTFAERIVRASRTPVGLRTAIGKVSHSAATGRSYRGLTFERLPDEEQPRTKLLRRVKRQAEVKEFESGK